MMATLVGGTGWIPFNYLLHCIPRQQVSHFRAHRKQGPLASGHLCAEEPRKPKTSGNVDSKLVLSDGFEDSSVRRSLAVGGGGSVAGRAIRNATK